MEGVLSRKRPPFFTGGKSALIVYHALSGAVKSLFPLSPVPTAGSSTHAGLILDPNGVGGYNISMDEHSGNLPATKNPIDPRYVVAVTDVLTRYMLGEGRIIDLLENEPALSRTTFYRLKKEYPESWAELEASARRAALAARSIDRLAFEARQEHGSHDLREIAREITTEGLEYLRTIVRGGTYTVHILEYDPDIEDYATRRKTVVIYPRDQIAAFNSALAAAQQGVMSTELVPVRLDEPGSEEAPALPSFLGASADFTNVTLTAADGQRIVIERTRDGEVIEVEE